MKASVFGTGIVARTISAKLLEVGYEVTMGTRDVANTMESQSKDGYGNPPFSVWKATFPKIKLATFADAASFSDELIFNCTSGTATLEVLKQAGSERLTGKILIDIANPLDFSKGMPPSLTVCNTDSLGEQVQRAHPELKVVKTLNTMNTFVMVNPGLVPGDHTVFMSGNDAGAKEVVAKLLTSFGWPKKNILDLGDITSARGTEMLLPVWLRIWGSLGTGNFNFQIQK